MIQPSDGRPTYAFRVMSRPGVVTCATCGCRLTPSASEAGTWYHFAPFDGRDARGCIVPCAEAAHDAGGHIVVASIA